MPAPIEVTVHCVVHFDKQIFVYTSSFVDIACSVYNKKATGMHIVLALLAFSPQKNQPLVRATTYNCTAEAAEMPSVYFAASNLSDIFVSYTMAVEDF